MREDEGFTVTFTHAGHGHARYPFLDGQLMTNAKRKSERGRKERRSKTKKNSGHNLLSSTICVIAHYTPIFS